MKRLAVMVVPALVAVFFLGVYLSKAAVQLTPPSQPIPPAYFGMHFVAGNTPWPSVPVGSWRLWDTSLRWPDIEPSKGHWNFDGFDEAIAEAQQHNADVLLPLAVTPQWASAHPDVKSGWQQPGLTSEPSSMDDWRAFVTKVATRYKGRIRAYEIWNEPNLKQYWMGNTDQLIALTREAHDAIKAVDPNALIVSPAATTSGGVGWLDEFLSKGGGQYVDVIGYHFYVFPQPPEAMADLIQRVKQTMAKNGVGKPLWGTEIGWAEPKPFPSDEMGAAYVARAYTISWAAGVSRLFWYAWDNHKWAALQTTEADNRTLKPAGQADGVIQQWMSGAVMDWCNKSDDGFWSCQLERSGTKEWIVWNTNGMKGFSVPSSWHATTMTPLLGQAQPVSSSKVQVGPTPALLSTSGR